MFLKKANNYLIFEKGREISELFFFQFFSNHEKYVKNPSFVVMSTNEKKYREVVSEGVKSENFGA